MEVANILSFPKLGFFTDPALLEGKTHESIPTYNLGRKAEKMSSF
jgi:hypothetical protein